MVYLEHSGDKFWRCEKTSARTVTLSYGKVGTAGRTMKKTDFKNAKAAAEYVEKQEATKRRGGYEDATDPNGGGAASSSSSSRGGGKRKKAAAAAPAPPTPTKKAGLAGHAAPDLDDGDGVAVDSGVAGVDSALASRARVHGTLRGKLALVDPAKNHDKYYVLQVLVDDGKKKPRGRKKATAGAAGPQFYLFMRWGRTGSGGQAKLEGPFGDEEDAEEEFAKIFKSKTGVAWSKAVPGAAPKKGKYEYLSVNRSGGGDGDWYYYLKNDPLGKPDGWYAYEEENRAETEELHSEYSSSGSAARLSTRLVHSESSGFTYRVDLRNMTQTNTQSGTTRPIQRTDKGKVPSKKPPKKKPSATPSPSSSAATPHRSVSAKSPATKSAPAAVRSLAKPMSAATAGAVDPAVSARLQDGSVYGEFDAMLNQTNLGANNNKFYKLQLVETDDGIFLFTKWGRVGEAGATQEAGPMDSDRAIKEFEKKFKSKTANNWDDRDDFQSRTGKYTLVEMEKDADAAEAMSSCASVAASGASAKKVLPSELDSKTKGLVDLIFDEDMFKTAMSAMNLDPQKLPLGALSKAQIERGFDALERLEEELDGRARANTLMELTSDFYTVIPHSFGRSRGPVLNTKEMVKEKYEMLNTLTDIEAAQAMQKKNKNETSDEAQEHPSDRNYKQLCADLTLVGVDDDERSILEKYLKDTKSTGYHSGMKLRDLWRVDRHDESKRYAAHSDLSNRKLLWHGTNVAVVAAILKSGLRIMPHSGGRVGRGIYLADQHEKSAWYISPARNTVIMFLVEAALGKQYEITRDDPSLTSAPKGFDSVLAKGTKAPPNEAVLDIDGNDVKVPQGKPKDVKGTSGSSFAHNEFLIYKESQHRIRYILAFDQ